MLEGPLFPNIIRFTIPIILTSVLQLLFNAADLVVVGQFCGSVSVAAVGATGSITGLLVNFFIGLSVGAGVAVAHGLGGRENQVVHRTVHTALPTAILSGAILTVAGLTYSETFLIMMGTPDTVLPLSTVYMRIIFCGVTFNMVYNFCASILRAAGDTKSPLVFLLFAGVLNVILNLVFVIQFQMNVAGVALATVLAQTISAFLCLWKLLRMRDVFDLTLHYLKPCSAPIANIIRIGVPSGITQAIFSVAMLVVQSLTNSFGEMVIACNVIVMRVDGFAMMPNFTFGQAMTTYTGQNVGARRLDRVHQGAKQGTWIAVGISAFLTALILLFGRQLMGVFTETAVLVDLSMRMMQILAFGYIAMSITQCLSGVMRGAGDTMTPMWISIITTVVLRVPIAYGIAFFTRSAEYPTGRPESTFISLLVSWSLGALLTAVAYRFGAWRKRLATAEPAPQL